MRYDDASVWVGGPFPFSNRIEGAGFVLAAVGILCFGIWVYLTVARGGFWRLPACLEDEARLEGPSIKSWPRVTAVVPARNEAATIGPTIASLFQQDYPGRLSVSLMMTARMEQRPWRGARQKRSAQGRESKLILQARCRGDGPARCGPSTRV